MGDDLLQWRSRIGVHLPRGDSGGLMFIVETPACDFSHSLVTRGRHAAERCIPILGAHPFKCFNGATFGGVRDLEPCTIFDPTGRTCECNTLCPAALFLAALIQDGDVARVLKASLSDYGLRSGLVEAVTMLRTELDGLTMHAEPLKSLVWGHQVSGITRILRCLMADVLLRTADDEILVTDEMYVPKEAALGISMLGTLVPAAAVVRLVAALGLRTTLLLDRDGTVHRRDVGANDAPFLGGLLVCDGHMSAVICEGHAPAPMLTLAPCPICIRFGVDGGALLRLEFSMKPIP